MRLADKVAIITGAGSGMGQATALRFAEEGAHLILNDLRQDAAASTEARIGAGHHWVLGDVSLESTAIALASKAEEIHGRVDILVNNAGVLLAQEIGDTGPDQWQHIIDVNLSSMVFCAKHVLPMMVRQGSGAIVNFSSISAFVGQEIDGQSTFAYNITKAGALQLTRSLATRYAPHGIRVNAVCPGAIRTNLMFHMDPAWTAEADDAFWAGEIPLVPLRRVGTPEEVANAVLFLASDESSYVTGHGLVVDGGMMVQ